MHQRADDDRGGWGRRQSNKIDDSVLVELLGRLGPMPLFRFGPPIIVHRSGPPHATSKSKLLSLSLQPCSRNLDTGGDTVTSRCCLIMGHSYWTVSVTDADDNVQDNGNNPPSAEIGMSRTRVSIFNAPLTKLQHPPPPNCHNQMDWIGPCRSECVDLLEHIHWLTHQERSLTHAHLGQVVAALASTTASLCPLGRSCSAHFVSTVHQPLQQAKLAS